jgi:hypothetical protein
VTRTNASSRMQRITKALLTRNVGTTDRVLRAIPAIVVAALWWLGTLSGTAALLLSIFAGMLLVTSVSGRCSIYAATGVSTYRPRVARAETARDG